MTYLYKCKHCDEEFEVVDLPVKHRDLPCTKQCPHCGTKGYIVRQICPVPFHLKGGGWADDGYSEYLGNNPKFKGGKFTALDLKD